MKHTIKDIIIEKGTGKDAVIPILQAIQKYFNYLPEEALEIVCDYTEITPAEIVGVASFFSQFRFKPAGKHLVKVCVGTACHVKGAELVYDSLRRVLHLEGDHDTDLEGIFTIEKVSCLGCCSLAPAVQIDNITYGHVTPATSKEILDDFILRQNEGCPQGDQGFASGSCTRRDQGRIGFLLCGKWQRRNTSGCGGGHSRRCIESESQTCGMCGYVSPGATDRNRGTT
jgi:NADH:ubiquinone oxidoreductase subunit E